MCTSRSRRKACCANFCASPPDRFRRGADGVPGLQREFCVDDQWRRAVRHFHGAIRPAAVGKCLLEGVAALRQPIGDDRLHARLAEGAARLLVGQDRLQLHHLAGQRLDVVLRGVDHGEPFLQPRKVLMRRLGLFGHGLADAAGHGVEALADRLVEFGLAGAEHVGGSAHAPLHLGLRLQDAGHARLRFAGVLGRLGRGKARAEAERQSETINATSRHRNSTLRPASAWPSVNTAAPSRAIGWRGLSRDRSCRRT